jgi:hypothetical protein
MATPSKKKPKPRSSQHHTTAHRESLRARGLHPAPFRLPDLSDPEVLAEIRREGDMMAKHPDNAAIDDWIDRAVDWNAWQ